MNLTVNLQKLEDTLRALVIQLLFRVLLVTIAQKALQVQPRCLVRRELSDLLLLAQRLNLVVQMHPRVEHALQEPIAVARVPQHL